MIDFFFSTLSSLIALACIVLISLWSSNDDFGYLGTPSWDKNLFAVHPVMMVSGFFPAMSLAIAITIILKAYPSISKYSHLGLQIIAIVFLIVGLYAVIKLIDDQGSDHLTVAHSWLGIIVVVGIFLNVCTGLIKTFLIRDKTSEAFNTLNDYHDYLGNFDPPKYST